MDDSYTKQTETTRSSTRTTMASSDWYIRREGACRYAGSVTRRIYAKFQSGGERADQASEF